MKKARPTMEKVDRFRLAEGGRLQRISARARQGWGRTANERYILVVLVLTGFLTLVVVWVVTAMGSPTPSGLDWTPDSHGIRPSLFDVARAAAPLAGIFAAAILAGAALLRQRSTDLELEHEAVAALHTRYTEAAKQLGDEKAAVRLAGVYAMAALADDWLNRGNTADAQACVNVLCAYLRMPRASDEETQDQDEAQDQDRDQETPVRDAIIAALTSHRDILHGTWKSLDFNLKAANLAGANLTRANLTEADLTKADLERANLAGATLTGANLTWANLDGADLDAATLTAANLTEAYLTEADLTEADLRGANLTEADLRGADLTEANLTEANLDEANLTEANLRRANLTEANLTEANLRRANLTEATLTEANLSKANLSKANLSKANLTDTNLTDTNLTATSPF
ncbi:MAG: pentapeptide repeat-containing protein [Actinomycetales bacterium]